jgi:two-component system response regulator YesN
MPKMNGIDLAKYIYEYHSDIKVIILTGYSDFSYAQSAIQYNVCGFVLKPTSTEKIFEAITKAKNIISKERIHKNKIDDLESKLSHHQSEMQQHFLLDVLSNIYTDPKIIREKMNSLHISLQNYCSIVTQIHTANHYDAEKEKHYIWTLKNCISEAFKDKLHYSVIVNNSEICTFVCFNESNHMQNLQHVVESCSEMIDMANTFLDFEIHGGIGLFHQNPSNITTAYTEACQALSNQFYSNTENIFIYSSIPDHLNAADTKIMNESIEQIIYLIENSNWIEVDKKLRSLFRHLKNSMYPIKTVKNSSILLYSFITKSLLHHVPSKKELEHTKNIYTKIHGSQSIDDLYKILSTTIHSASDITVSESSTSEIVKKVTSYIQQHFNENISLSSIAETMHVNSSYLSRLFKKETNNTLTVAITKIRMEKAKELLLTTDKKIYEIANAVGIEDATYFSQLFKKYTGLNPKEYKCTT